jgi:hypothetical protein
LLVRCPADEEKVTHPLDGRSNQARVSACDQRKPARRATRAGKGAEFGPIRVNLAASSIGHAPRVPSVVPRHRREACLLASCRADKAVHRRHRRSARAPRRAAARAGALATTRHRVRPGSTPGSAAMPTASGGRRSGAPPGRLCPRRASPSAGRRTERTWTPSRPTSRSPGCGRRRSIRRGVERAASSRAPRGREWRGALSLRLVLASPPLTHRGRAAGARVCRRLAWGRAR